MTTLRVLLAQPAAPDRVEPWALFDDAGACIRTGRDAPAAWPAADRAEAVLAAAQVRIAAVTLPPLAPSRVGAAAGFAVDDQLAGPREAQHVAVSRQQTDGRVRVVIAARAVMSALRGPFGRVVAEPDLAPPHAGWRWCSAAGARGEGFVRRNDGSAFPVSATGADGTLPPELALAVAQARRDGASPPEIRVEGDAADGDLVRWKRDAGCAFARGAAWRWSATPPEAFANAVDLLQGEFALAPPASAATRQRLFVPALALVATALALHVVATVGEWSAVRFESWRQAREWRALATDAALAPESAATPAAAQAALSRRSAELRHVRGLAAPDDALPLLARAAAALRALPAGSVKTATYADSHWTIDLARADAAALADLDARLRGAGVPALVASTPAGVRVRLGSL